MARAALLLGVAMAAHLWVVPALTFDPRKSFPAASEMVQAGLPQPRYVAAGATLSVPAPAIRIRTELVGVRERPAELPSPTGDHAGNQPEAVGTSGAGRNVHAEQTVATAMALVADVPLPRREIAPPRIPEPAVTQAGTRDRTEALGSTLPPGTAAAASPVALVSSDAGADVTRRDEDIVRQVLQDYARAYERLDVQAAKAIYPTVDGRALQRAFEQLDAQQLQFASCGVVLTGRDANARCRGDATYRPKVGSRTLRLTAREWTFNLSRDNDRWQIVKATLQ